MAPRALNLKERPMTDVEIALGLGAVGGFMLTAGAMFVSDLRNAQVVETISPDTYQTVVEVTAERVRQVTVEGFTSLKDDQYLRGELVWAAVSYAGYAGDPTNRFMPAEWPWAARWWKPESPRRALVKAAALILAEIERLDRAAARKAGALNKDSQS